MKKSLFFLNQLITTLALSMIFVSLFGLNSIAQAKTEEKPAACTEEKPVACTEEKRAACVLTDFDRRVIAQGPCNVILTYSNTDVEFDIEWDGSISTQFSMREFPTNGTYRIKIRDGKKDRGVANMQVENDGTVFIFSSDRGFNGRVIFTH